MKARAYQPLRARFAGALALILPLLPACKSGDPGTQAEGASHSDGGQDGPGTAVADAPVVAKVGKIRGSRGLSSPDLPEGAFLGEGAALHAGQWIELPRGTRVEVELTSGVRLRLDEDSKLRLPEAGEDTATLQLERGRLIVLAEAGPGSDATPSPVVVAAADDRLTVERGEVELHHAGETRHYGVVTGRAVLHTAERDIPLGPGASISTPVAVDTRPETPPDPNILAFTPSLSLDPLHEAAWAKAFEDSQTLAQNLPPGVGSLVARRAGSSVERQSLRISEQKVKVSISGRIARTEIEQAFFNDSSQTLEGIYEFPLPADASISDLQLLIGSTWMRGEMLEKNRARQIFRQIVDATVPRDPALLQWDQGSVFKLNIFPIPGKGERRIKIAYTQVLPDVGDNLRYRYPMGGSGATADEIGDFEFAVEIDGRGLDEQALAAVTTPMAELARSREGDKLALSMRERDFAPSHELGVDIPLVDDERRVLAATHRDRDGQGYFMLTLKPDLQLQADPRPVHYAFVLDRSHGTSPDLWTAAEGMTKAMLATLEPDDRFTILACDTACDRLSGGLRSPAGDTLTSLDDFLDRQVIAGASDIGNMLEQAGAALGDDPNTDAERVIVYLGDGVPTSGALTPDELGEIVEGPLADLRVQAVALGARADMLVLDNLVRESGGDLIKADARDDLEIIARELRLRAQVPVARDLNLTLPPGLTDVYPRSLPALRPGDSLTLVGKLIDGDPSALRGDVILSGRGPGGTVDEHFQIMLDAEYSQAGAWAGNVHAHLPRTWAQQEITFLTQHEGAAAKDRIIALSRDYNVLSRWTALLVLENDRMYREFNVARKADNKDGWGGKLGGGEAKPTDVSEPATAASEATATPAQPQSAPSGSAPIEESSDKESSREEQEQEPAPDAAPADFGERGPSSFDEAEDREGDFGGDIDDFDGEIGGGGSKDGLFGDGGSGRGSGSGGGFAPPPPEKAKKSESKSSAPKPQPSSPKGDIFNEDFPGGGGWGGGGGWKGGRGGWRPPQMLVRDAGGPSPDERSRIAELQRIRDVKVGDRKAHRDLVTKAMRAGDPNRLAFAAAWAEADPDHAPALLAHADALAAAGDPLALRAYASAVEVEAFSTKLHGRMADALTQAGDFERACSHRRALVSIDPSNGSYAADLVECLVQSGRIASARAAAARASGRVSGKDKQALSKAAKAIDQGFVTSKSVVHSSPDLRAELRWSVGENLDIAFVDRRGQRLSVMRPQGVLAREERDGAERVEILTMRQVKGTVFIEVTRPESNSEDPVFASLLVKTPSGRKTWTLRLDPGTQRVALAKWE